VKTVNQRLNELKLEKHPDKTFIRRIEKDFDFLGYHFSRKGLAVAMDTLKRFVERATRLYEQEQEPTPLLGLYVRRWVKWSLDVLGEQAKTPTRGPRGIVVSVVLAFRKRAAFQQILRRAGRGPGAPRWWVQGSPQPPAERPRLRACANQRVPAIVVNGGVDACRRLGLIVNPTVVKIRPASLDEVPVEPRDQPVGDSESMDRRVILVPKAVRMLDLPATR